MAIGSAVQKGAWVYVYDEKGHQLTSISGELMGYTGSSFSVKKEHGFMFMTKKGVS